MKTFNLLLILFSISFFLACDDNEPGDNRAHEEINAIVSDLESNTQISTFVNALKTLDLQNVNETEFTVFALKNEAITSLKSTEMPGISQSILKRYIVKGAYTIEKLKEIDKIENIAGESLVVSVDADENIFINGVALGTPVKASNSMVYVIDWAIPSTPEVGKTITFKVYECNTNWSVSNPEAGFLSEGATITLYDEKGNEYKIIQTGTNGTASVNISEEGTYSYLIEKNGMSNLYNGYLITGVFTSQEEIDNSPVFYSYEISGQKKLGGLIFSDLNGDALINSDDKVERGYLNTDSDVIEAYIYAEKLVSGDIEITDEMVNSLIKGYNESYTYFLNLDNNFSTYEQRQTITPTDYQVNQFWAKAYYTIRLANILLDKDREKQSEYKSKLLKLRALPHLQLAAMFGDVPLVTKVLDMDEASRITRTNKQSVLDYVLSELNQSYELMPANEKSDLLLNIAVLCLLNNQYENAKLKLEMIVQEGTLKWGASDESDNLFVATYLLLSESYLKTGRMTEAAQALNVVYEAQGKTQPVSPATSGDELENLIRTTHAQYQLGLTTINNSRWGISQAWDKYALMPIPQQELDLSFGLTQNPGW